MNKIPYIVKWSVGPAGHLDPTKTYLEPGLLTLVIGTQVAEDPNYRGEEVLCFKLGGEKPEEGLTLGHIDGELVQAVEQVQTLLLEAAFKARNIKNYAELPQELKATCADPCLVEKRPGPVVIAKTPDIVAKESIPQKLLNMMQRPFIG